MTGSPQLTLPNFIGIGAQRAATTWLFHCLREHPEVFIPEVKEVHFFSSYFDRGLDWYAGHFRGCGNQLAIGEISPSYLDLEDAIPNMARIVPEAKLFVILREPVERAYSAYRLYQQQYAHFRDKSFQEALDYLPALISGGFYASHMERVYQHYARERVHVLLYEDISTDPVGAFASLCRFIGVDDRVRPESLRKRYNVVAAPKLQKYLRKVGLKCVIEAVKGTHAGEWIKRRRLLRGAPAEKAISPAMRSRLKGIYREDTDRLKRLIGRDLRAWR